MSEPSRPRIEIIGTGLIGASIGLALRERGWHVSGRDLDSGRASRALEIGAVDRIGEDQEAETCVVATPAGAVADEVSARSRQGLAITDVAGVKAPIVERISDPMYVGGHPMAGSEQEGVDGASGDLFVGATWVLTPTAITDPQAHARIRALATSLGADVVEVDPSRHDALVALISHVPHLTAATLMNLAADTALEHATLLRLAAGGFRDMTRISAGDPAIWPDVCEDNASAIVEVLDRLLGELGAIREVVANRDREQLLKVLDSAKDARRNLPVGAPPPSETVEVRIPIADRPAALAEVTTLLGEVGVNMFDFEVAHSIEGGGGVLVMVVAAQAVPVVRQLLSARGYRLSFHRMSR